ncbi:MAG: hypothetical protein WAO07_11480, partial [Desulfobacterales bacterium]
FSGIKISVIYNPHLLFKINVIIFEQPQKEGNKMENSTARSSGEKSTPTKDTVDRLADNVDNLREKASETIRELKTEAKSTGEKIKMKAREAASQTGAKIKGTADAVIHNEYPADADTATRTAMYVGVSLVAAGLVIGVAALLYGKSEKREPSRTATTPDEVTDTLARARAEAADTKKSNVIVTPQEYAQEEA